jgi:hypothetical protein
MSSQTESTDHLPDPAGIFACALSLWHECKQHAAANASLNLSESYNGMDQFMREVMRIASQFETWACKHVHFDDFSEIWPYHLEESFGKACLAVILPSALAEFDETDCLRVAMHLKLPIIIDDELRVPIDVKAMNPVPGSAFREFRIQTARDSIEDDDSAPFTPDDDPFDEEFGAPYVGLYGISDDGLLEHIADRRTYAEAVTLARKLAPGVEFPQEPVFSAAPRASDDVGK